MQHLKFCRYKLACLIHSISEILKLICTHLLHARVRVYVRERLHIYIYIYMRVNTGFFEKLIIDNLSVLN
jgi:hypothetical protein